MWLTAFDFFSSQTPEVRCRRSFRLFRSFLNTCAKLTAETPFTHLSLKDIFTQQFDIVFGAQEELVIEVNVCS